MNAVTEKEVVQNFKGFNNGKSRRSQTYQKFYASKSGDHTAQDKVRSVGRWTNINR